MHLDVFFGPFSNWIVVEFFFNVKFSSFFIYSRYESFARYGVCKYVFLVAETFVEQLVLILVGSNRSISPSGSRFWC